MMGDFVRCVYMIVSTMLAGVHMNVSLAILFMNVGVLVLMQVLVRVYVGMWM